MKYAVFDHQGLPTAFYAVGDVWPIEKVPPEAFEITEDQWQEFIDNPGRRRWADGEVAPYEPPPVEPPFPSVVSASQAKIALFNAGYLDDVEAVVAAHPYRIVQIWFTDANTWERGNPYVQAIGAEIGLTDEQMDELFIAASLI